MTIRKIEINDTLDDILDSVNNQIKDLIIKYIKNNPDHDTIELSDLNHDGSVHEIIDSSIPIYRSEIKDLWYLYGDQFEQAFDDAGFDNKTDNDWPNGWKAAAIFSYIEQYIDNTIAVNNNVRKTK